MNDFKMQTCDECGVSISKKGKFCSRRCYLANHAIKYTIAECPYCKTKFNRNENAYRKKQYCSIKCRYNAVKVNGHEYVTSQGYVAVKIHGHPMAFTDGYVLKHRLVMANMLNRMLKEDEHVHHIDENKLNNDPKNLRLTSNRDHQISHNSHERLNTKEAIRKRVRTRWGYL